MSKFYLAASALVTFPFFLLLAGLSLSAVDIGWAPLFLGFTSVILAILGARRGAAIDLILAVFVTWVIGLQLLSLLIWPEFIAYQDSDFYLANVSADTVRSAFLLLLSFSVGWLVIATVDVAWLGSNKLRTVVGTELIPAVLAWLFVSVVVTAALGAIYGVGVAGAIHDFPFEGIVYYVFPADYLAVALATGLGFGVGAVRRLRVPVALTLVLYLVVKLGLGWKSPILNVSLAYFIGVFYEGRSERFMKFLPVLGLVIALYALVVKPAADFVRTGGEGWPVTETVAVKVDGLNPFASRLTEGTLFAAAAIESNAIERQPLGLVMVGKDFINRLVPGTIWDVRSTDRVFTEGVLGQPVGIPSTFAPGVVGMAAMLGGAGAGFGYGLAARLVFTLLVALAGLARDITIRLFLMGSVAVSTVSLSIDGYFGGVERLGVVTIVLLIGLLALATLRWALLAVLRNCRGSVEPPF